jgi:YVTN family beta-propeller protein
MGILTLISLAQTNAQQKQAESKTPEQAAESKQQSDKQPATLPKESPPQYAGMTPAGFLLPNGWTITPAGKQVPLTDLPLNIIPLADNRHALVATSGYNTHELTLIELATQTKVTTISRPQSWFGLVANSKQDQLFWSGGGDGTVQKYTLQNHTLAADKIIASKFGEPEKEKEKAAPDKAAPAKPERLAGPVSWIPGGFKTGLYLDEAAAKLFVLTIFPRGSNKSFAWGEATTDEGIGGALTVIDLNEKVPPVTVPCGGRPYDITRGRNGLIYVSDWAQKRVLVLDPETLRTVQKIAVGDHPNQLALHPRDDRLFVTCGSSNCVSVIDTERGIVTETIMTSLFPKAPEGSTPDALCISPDGKSLYVANADNNCIAVIDIEEQSKSLVKGFIPTGWYPTSVAITPDGKQLLVGVGKGNQTKPNAPEAQPVAPEQPPRRIPFPHVGKTLSGALSIVPIPDEKQLADLTSTVYRNCPYSDELLSVAPHPVKTAIPNKVGDPSPIKYVIYIIKENRTYDQVFGDLPRGNGDPTLTLFGREITPNHHKLAEEFVLLDNLYCNGHVSADGHPWSTMAYNTDYISRNWALTYSRRAGIDDDDEGNLSRAPSGYIWDMCARNKLTYRSYGEYGGRVSQPDGTFRMEGRVPGLVGHMCPTFGIPNPDGSKSRDTDRVEVFLKEFREFEKNGTMPRLTIMSLGEDHTEGTRPGSPTPQACVASNDLALGRLVEQISNSKLWPEIAIFVIEDDAQNGPDHVDAHRTVGLVISPYVKRKSLDSTQYSTSSMLRTIELILGLPPMSQFDASARPMFASFTDKADTTPYVHERARIDLNARNTPLSYGAERSQKMDFTEFDKIDDFELNEILWRAIKGRDAPLPPSVRRAIAYRPATK